MMRMAARNRNAEIGSSCFPIALLAVAAIVAVGCGDRGGSTPVEEAPPPAAAGTGATPPLVDSRGREIPGAPAGEDGHVEGELGWNVPAGWVVQAPASAMRRAQYALPRAAGDATDGECAVFYFGPGQGGDVQSNIDRWAAQFTGPDGAAVRPQVETKTASGMKIHTIRAEGTYDASTMTGGGAGPQPGSMLLGAIVEGPGSNWFFKCTGPKSTMESHRAAFDSLVASVHPH
jgi:hypothetical protein